MDIFTEDDRLALNTNPIMDNKPKGVLYMKNILKAFGRTIRTIVGGTVGLVAIMFLFISWVTDMIAVGFNWISHKIGEIGQIKAQEENSEEVPT